MERIGPYEVLGRIGRGGSADIFLASTSGGGAGRRVVLKVLHPHLAEEEGYVRMFLDEARVMSLLPHPGIVRVFDLGEHAGTCYTAMELVDGPSLAAVLKLAPEPLPVDVACAIGGRVADALAFVHDAKDPATGQALELVHRDVAAPNILVSRDGDVKLTDFGIVRSKRGRELGILSTETTKGGTIKGRRATMSPEQILGHAVDFRTDLFSLGVVLWEALEGTKLWKSDGALDLVDEIARTPAPRLSRDVPGDVRSLVATLLEKDRDMRPASAAHVAKKLAPFSAPRERIAEVVRALDLPSLAV